MSGNMPCSSRLTGSMLQLTGERLTLEVRGHISVTLYIYFCIYTLYIYFVYILFSFISVL